MPSSSSSSRTTTYSYFTALLSHTVLYSTVQYCPRHARFPYTQTQTHTQTPHAQRTNLVDLFWTKKVRAPRFVRSTHHRRRHHRDERRTFLLLLAAFSKEHPNNQSFQHYSVVATSPHIYHRQHSLGTGPHYNTVPVRPPFSSIPRTVAARSLDDDDDDPARSSSTAALTTTIISNTGPSGRTTSRRCVCPPRQVRQVQQQVPRRRTRP